MKALITGGAGCIGSDLAAALLARGEEVTVFDNLSSGKIEHIAALLDHPEFRFVEGNLLDFARLVCAQRGGREHARGVAGMDTGLLDVLHDRAHIGLGAVAESVDVDLDRVLEEAA